MTRLRRGVGARSPETDRSAAAPVGVGPERVDPRETAIATSSAMAAGAGTGSAVEPQAEAEAASTAATDRAAVSIVATSKAVGGTIAIVKTDAADSAVIARSATVLPAVIARNGMVLHAVIGRSGTALRVRVARGKAVPGTRTGSRAPAADVTVGRAGTVAVRAEVVQTTSSGRKAAGPRAGTGTPVTTSTS